MTREERIALAVAGSKDAERRVRIMHLDAAFSPPRAAHGHMPFVGHRTQETVRLQQDAARKRERKLQRHRRAMEYGFDPDSLKVGEA